MLRHRLFIDVTHFLPDTFLQLAKSLQGYRLFLALLHEISLDLMLAGNLLLGQGLNPASIVSENVLRV
jgi:hypothetical protein